ncbi:MAG TPA: CBS domain-containing protein [Acidiferrobacterales bacterium]
MAAQPTVESAMTAYPYAIEIDDHAASARSMMAQFRIHHLPVTEGGRLVGVVSEWGIKRAVELGHDLSTGGATRVRDVYSADVLRVAPDEPLVAVLEQMAARHAQTVMVVRDDALLGIFTFTDACRHYAELLRSRG